MRAKRAHEKRLKRFSHGGWRRSPFSVHGLAEQVGHSLVGKRPTGAFSDSTRFPLEGERKQGMDNLRFTSIAKRYATGISFTVRSKIAYRRSPRARTPAAYFKARSRPFGNPFSRKGVGKYELRTAGASRPALPVVLALRICSEGFGTTANQVQVLYSSGAQCGSTICFCGADLRAWSWVFWFLRLPSFIVEVLCWIRG